MAIDIPAGCVRDGKLADVCQDYIYDQIVREQGKIFSRSSFLLDSQPKITTDNFASQKFYPVIATLYNDGRVLVPRPVDLDMNAHVDMPSPLKILLVAGAVAVSVPWGYAAPSATFAAGGVVAVGAAILIGVLIGNYIITTSKPGAMNKDTFAAEVYPVKVGSIEVYLLEGSNADDEFPEVKVGEAESLSSQPEPPGKPPEEKIREREERLTKKNDNHGVQIITGRGPLEGLEDGRHYKYVVVVLNNGNFELRVSSRLGNHIKMFEEGELVVAAGFVGRQGPTFTFDGGSNMFTTYRRDISTPSGYTALRAPQRGLETAAGFITQLFGVEAQRGEGAPGVESWCDGLNFAITLM